jgi:hypothetical protein
VCCGFHMGASVRRLEVCRPGTILHAPFWVDLFSRVLPLIIPHRGFQDAFDGLIKGISEALDLDQAHVDQCIPQFVQALEQSPKVATGTLSWLQEFDEVRTQVACQVPAIGLLVCFINSVDGFQYLPMPAKTSQPKQEHLRYIFIFSWLLLLLLSLIFCGSFFSVNIDCCVSRH